MTRLFPHHGVGEGLVALASLANPLPASPCLLNKSVRFQILQLFVDGLDQRGFARVYLQQVKKVIGIYRFTLFQKLYQLLIIRPSSSKFLLKKRFRTVSA